MKKIYLLLAIISAIFLAPWAQAAFNPAAKYCEQMGYDYVIKDNDAGQSAYCVFPDKTSCDDWAFFTGKCGQKFNYCTLKGYVSKTGSGEKCATSYAADCTLCVVSSQETPMVEVMDKNGEPLEFTENNFSFTKKEKPTAFCGNNECEIGETIENCSVDCKPSSSPSTATPKKQDFTGFIIVGIVVVILILSGVAYLVYKKFLGT